MFGRTSASFDKLLDKATSHLNLEPEWASILQICDCVRQGDVQPKYAINAIKKKLYDPNPHVVIYSIQILESCVKNCGSVIHIEVSSRTFMEELRDLIKLITNENAKSKLLELLQAWAFAFRNEPKYRAVQDTVTLLKLDGFKFPALQESDHMFSSDQAPEWKEGDCCHRCRAQFSLVQRKHHCRNCGQIFCNRCSSKLCPIPRFGIERDVRVCDTCFDNLNKPSSSKPDSSETSPKEVPKMDANSRKKEDELREEEELQLVLALSQSEAEAQEKNKKIGSTSAPASTATNKTYSPPMAQERNASSAGIDNELAYYLNRDYWEQKQKETSPPENRASPQPSAPINHPETIPIKTNNEKYQNGEIDQNMDFLANLKTTIEIFINRMTSNSSRGRPLANDTYVQSLFMNLTNMHAQLFKSVQEQDDNRAHYEMLQDKLAQIKDARGALDALRDEHREKIRLEAEEAERQRQVQMAHKLEIMRKKKQEYLQYQRQLAIQKMQEQELQLRHEQQKHQYQAAMYQPPQVPIQGAYVPHTQTIYQSPPPPPQTVNYTPLPPNPPVYYPPENYNLPPTAATNVVPPPFNMQGMMNALPQSGDMPPIHYSQMAQPPLPPQHSQTMAPPVVPQPVPLSQPPTSMATSIPAAPEGCLISFD